MSEIDSSGPRRRRDAWRVGTPLIVLISGGLFAISAVDSEGTDLRPGRYTDLAALVRAEAEEYEELEERVAALQRDVDALTKRVNEPEVQRYQRVIAEYRDPAGFEPREGPGVSVTMSDAPGGVIDEAVADDDLDPNLLVVHQQDLQAVVNAMWAGGATAVTIQGQRVITTTGIKCKGNAVQLQGVPYPQPYHVQAVGDPDAIQAALDADPAVGAYREDAADPDIQVGWDLEVEDNVVAPAFEGLYDLKHAEPIEAP